jgi:hypothetical protein
MMAFPLPASFSLPHSRTRQIRHGADHENRHCNGFAANKNGYTHGEAVGGLPFSPAWRPTGANLTNAKRFQEAGRGPLAVTTPRPSKPIRVRIACLWGAAATVESGTRAQCAWLWVSMCSGAFVFGLRARPFQAGLVFDSPVPRNFELF